MIKCFQSQTLSNIEHRIMSHPILYSIEKIFSSTYFILLTHNFIFFQNHEPELKDPMKSQHIPEYPFEERGDTLSQFHTNNSPCLCLCLQEDHKWSSFLPFWSLARNSWSLSSVYSLLYTQGITLISLCLTKTKQGMFLWTC